MIQERLTAIFRHPMINSTYKFKKKGAHYLNESSLLRCRTRFHTIKIESRPNLKITICDDLKHPWPQFTTWTISSTPLKYWFPEDKSGIKNTQLRLISQWSEFLINLQRKLWTKIRIHIIWIIFDRCDKSRDIKINCWFQISFEALKIIHE